MASGKKTRSNGSKPLPANALPAILDGAAVDKPPLEIRVDISQLTFGDLKIVAKFQGKTAEEMNMLEILPLLERVIVGGIDNIRIVYIPEIMDAIDAAFGEAGNPKNLTGG